MATTYNSVPDSKTSFEYLTALRLCEDPLDVSTIPNALIAQGWNIPQLPVKVEPIETKPLIKTPIAELWFDKYVTTIISGLTEAAMWYKASKLYVQVLIPFGVFMLYVIFIVIWRVCMCKIMRGPSTPLEVTRKSDTSAKYKNVANT